MPSITDISRHSPARRREEPIGQAGGAKVQSKGVVGDGHIVMGDGPESAEAFGKALVEVLAGRG